jgi:hypothetical protein
MEIIKTKSLTEIQFQQINQLWNQEYPVNLKDRFGILLEGAENYNHYIIEDKNHDVLAWAVDFEKDNEVRFSIIVKGTQQGKGFGSSLMKNLMNELPEFYGWVIDHDDDKKVNGENYKSPLAFYLKLGFEVVENMRIDNEMLKAVKIRRRA